MEKSDTSKNLTTSISNAETFQSPTMHMAFMAAPRFVPQSHQPSTTRLPKHIVMLAEKRLDLRTFDRFSDTHSPRSYDNDYSNSSEFSSPENSLSKTSCDAGTPTNYENTEQSPSPQRYKKGSFVFPKASEKDITAAQDRIRKALKQVPDNIHFDLNRQRHTTTLYLGNLDYNASEQDVSEALVAPVFRKIRVENVTVPNVNGRSVYGFIDISWAHDILIKESDICTAFNTGKIQVSGRPIYFRPLRHKAGSQ
jgi:hypothetical protein